MWIRQCELDAQSDATLPIPSRIASNEEFIPPPQSREQQEYEARALDKQIGQGRLLLKNQEQGRPKAHGRVARLLRVQPFKTLARTAVIPQFQLDLSRLRGDDERAVQGRGGWREGRLSLQCAAHLAQKA